MSGRPSHRHNLVAGETEHWHPPVYGPASDPLGKLRAALLRFLDLQSKTIWKDLSAELPKVKGTVVDAGCGAQPFRQLFGPDVRYIGIDTSDAKSHFGFNVPGVIYYSGKKWPLAGKTADCILCTETLEHVLEPAIFLKEAFRCLKPGGRLLLTVPFSARWHFVSHDYWRYTPAGLDKLLKEAGFYRIQVFARGNQFTVVCYKWMAFVFSLLRPKRSNFFFESLCRLVGTLSLPLVLMAAIMAHMTLEKPGSVDCLGFTVMANRPAGKARRVPS